jgi:hypothetical protein
MCFLHDKKRLDKKIKKDDNVTIFWYILKNLDPKLSVLHLIFATRF